MAKNKTLKVLSTGTVAGMIAAAVLSSQAFAAVDAYSVKIGDDVLKYDKAALTESFLASKAGDAAPLYEDFTAKLAEAKGFYAFSDAKTGKFVSYNDIQAKFLEAKAAGEAFVVDNYTESATAEVIAVPTVKKVVVKDGKVVVEADGTTTPSTGVVSVSAINWSPSQSVASGQALVNVGSITLTASQDTTINGLKIKRSGLSADLDVSNISIWEGTTRLNVPGVLSNNLADLTFTAPLTIKAGESKTISVKMNVAAAAPSGSQLLFSVDSIKTSASVSGSIAGTSGTYTVSNVQLGTLAVGISPDAPTQNIDAGSKDVTLGKFDVTAQTEKQVLNTMTFTQNGNIAQSDLENLKLYYNGTEIAKGANIGDNKVTFNIKNGLDLTNGTTVSLVIKGDVVGGSSRTIRFGINDENDVQSVGKTYGTTVVSNGTFDGQLLTVNTGRFLVARSTNTPAAGTIGATVNDQAFTTFKVEAIGEPIQLRTVSLDANALVGAVTDLTDVKIWAGDQVLANVQAPFTAANAGVVQFTLNNPITVTPGTPVELKVTADLNGAAGQYRIDLDGTDADGLNSAVITTMTGVGNVSGRNVTLGVANDIQGNTQTVGAVVVNASISPSRGSSTVFANQTNHHFTTFNINNTLSETVQVYQVSIQGSANAAQIANLKLTNTNGDILTDVIANPVAGNNILTLKTPLEIAANANVELKVIGDATSTANTTYQFSPMGSISGATPGASVVRIKSNGTLVTFNGIANANAPLATASSAAPHATVTARGDAGEVYYKGQKDAVIGQFRITEDTASQAGNTASDKQEIVVTEIDLLPVATEVQGAGLLNNGDIKNIRIVDSEGNVYATLPYFTSTDFAVANTTADTITLTAPITIKADKYKDIKVIADIDSDVAAARLSDTFQLSIGDGGATGDIVIRGVATGVEVSNINVETSSITTFAVQSTKIKVEKGSVANLTPVVGVGAEVGRFVLTNEGSEELILTQLDFAQVLNTLPGTAQIQAFDAETGIALSTSTAVGNLTINQGTASDRTIKVGKTKTIAIRVSDATGIVAGQGINLRLLKSSTYTSQSVAGQTLGTSVVGDVISFK